MIDDIAGNRVFIFTGRRYEQMGDRSEPFERQLLPCRRVVGADDPDPRLTEQRLAIEPFGDPPEAAYRKIGPPKV